MPEQLDPTILTEWARMCKTTLDQASCCQCHLGPELCDGNPSEWGAERIANIISAWSAAHPLPKPKTRKDVFLERNPGARLDDSGHPYTCPQNVGLAPIDLCNSQCWECWDAEYIE